jgi:methyl-accepting chemotaxis protein
MTLTIGRQIGAAFALVLALFAAVAAVAVMQMGAMQSETSRIEAASPLDAAARDVLTQLLNEETAVRGYVATGKPLFLDRYREGRTALPQDLAYIASHDADYPQLRRTVDGIGPTVDRIDSFFAGEIALVASGKRGQAADGLVAGKKTFGTYRKAAQAIPAATAVVVADAAARFTQVRILALRTMIAASVLALVVSAFAATLLGRRIARRLNAASNGLREIVDRDFARLLHAFDQLERGDLTASFSAEEKRLDERGGDEIAALAASYNALAAGLVRSARKFGETTSGLRAVMRGVAASSAELVTASVQVSAASEQSNVAVEQISQAIHGVAVAARQQSTGVSAVRVSVDEVANTSAQIANGAADQAGAVQRIGGGVVRLDEQIRGVADLGETLATASRHASDEAAAGRAAVDDASAAMVRIQAQTISARAAMTALEQRSDAVRGIVERIDAIADQTNLLALNAAIEAARAGDYGRGFSVVAEEIRTLAETSAASTREIAGILSEIRKETLEASKAMVASADAVESGLALASRATSSLAAVEQAVSEASRTAERVAGGTASMRDASTQVADNVAGVSSVVEQNAAAAGEMQATTGAVTHAVTPVAAAAEQQSAAAEEVSASAAELAAQTNEIALTARHVRAQAEALEALVSRFTLDDGTQAAVETAAAVSVARVRDAGRAALSHTLASRA